MAERRARVSADFVDRVLYAVYRAANEILGEGTWGLVWRSGEVLYEELERELGLEGVRDPAEVLSRLARWLVEVGYVERAEVRRVGEGELEYVMGRPAIARGAEELARAGLVPPHVSTSLMFAALRRRGLRAELVGGPTFLPDGTVVERWRLSRAV